MADRASPNPPTMTLNSGDNMEGESILDQLSREIVDKVLPAAEGFVDTHSEALGSHSSAVAEALNNVKDALQGTKDEALPTPVKHVTPPPSPSEEESVLTEESSDRLETSGDSGHVEEVFEKTILAPLTIDGEKETTPVSADVPVEMVKEVAPVYPGEISVDMPVDKATDVEKETSPVSADVPVAVEKEGTPVYPNESSADMSEDKRDSTPQITVEAPLEPPREHEEVQAVNEYPQEEVEVPQKIEEVETNMDLSRKQAEEPVSTVIDDATNDVLNSQISNLQKADSPEKVIGDMASNVVAKATDVVDNVSDLVVEATEIVAENSAVIPESSDVVDKGSDAEGKISDLVEEATEMSADDSVGVTKASDVVADVCDAVQEAATTVESANMEQIDAPKGNAENVFKPEIETSGEFARKENVVEMVAESSADMLKNVSDDFTEMDKSLNKKVEGNLESFNMTRDENAVDMVEDVVPAVAPAAPSSDFGNKNEEPIQIVDENSSEMDVVKAVKEEAETGKTEIEQLVNAAQEEFEKIAVVEKSYDTEEKIAEPTIVAGDNAMTDIKSNIEQFAHNLSDQITETVSAGVEKLSDVVSDVQEDPKQEQNVSTKNDDHSEGAHQEFGSSASERLAEAKEVVSDYVETAKENLQEMGSTVSEAVMEKVEDTKEAVAEVFEKEKEKVSEEVEEPVVEQPVIQETEEEKESLMETATHSFNMAKETVTDAAEKAVNTAVDTAVSTEEKIVEGVKDLKRRASQVSESAAEYISEKVAEAEDSSSSAYDDLKKRASEVSERVVEKVHDAETVVSAAATKAVDTVKNAVHEVENETTHAASCISEAKAAFFEGRPYVHERPASAEVTDVVAEPVDTVVTTVSETVITPEERLASEVLSAVLGDAVNAAASAPTPSSSREKPEETAAAVVDPVPQPNQTVESSQPVVKEEREPKNTDTLRSTRSEAPKRRCTIL